MKKPRKKRRVMKVDIWDYFDIEAMNERLDEIEGLTCSDIEFDCKNITKTGKLIVEARYYTDELEWE